MNSKGIKALLDKLGYGNNIVIILGNGSFKISITGECHVQQIKDIFNVIKWEYDGNKVVFYITTKE